MNDLIPAHLCVCTVTKGLEFFYIYHTYKRIGILKGEIFHAAAADVKKDLPGIEYPFKG